jgi:hypothetical protein
MNALLLSKHQETAYPPLILHVIHHFAVGGLENGLVNLINAFPTDRYRHAIVALTDYTDFRYRLQKKEVAVFALRKRAGHELGVYLRFWRVLQTLRPAIVHTRNFPLREYEGGSTGNMVAMSMISMVQTSSITFSVGQQTYL